MTKKTKESRCRRRLLVAWWDLVCTLWVIHRIDRDAAIRLAYTSRNMSVGETARTVIGGSFIRLLGQSSRALLLDCHDIIKVSCIRQLWQLSMGFLQNS